MAPTQTEYQHYIPQLLVRHFSFPFKCCDTEKKGKKRCKCKHEKGKHPGDLVVNCVDMSKTPFELKIRSVKRIFGCPDMYNDPSKSTTREQRQIESMFGKMESQASGIFRRIVRAHEAAETTVSLTRFERDLLRKFLFLLKYRGSGFHRRFYHERPHDYSANDRVRLLDYMTKHGFSTPLDVWFHNLKVIMNLKMDPDRNWLGELPRIMFPDDAFWFIMHVEYFFMAICTPSEAGDEFILTENSYNVFEGPNTFIQDKTTGQVSAGSHAGFHEFAPMSPRLTIVLRSNALPYPEEDHHHLIKRQREDEYWSSYGQVFGPSSKSLLEDLPIKKARNSYSEIIRGNIHLSSGHDGKYRLNDKFIFSFYPIESDHVRIINNIMLDNCYSNGTLAFRSHETFFDILQSYISGPCQSFKIVGGEESENRYIFLRNLETLARALGSQKSLIWRRISGPAVVTSDEFMEKQFAYRKMMDTILQNSGACRNSPVTAFLALYKALGKIVYFAVEENDSNAYPSTSDTDLMFHQNLSQASKMVHLRCIVEYYSLKCGKTVHIRNMMLVTSIFKASSCAKFWLYLKLVRKHSLVEADGTQDFVELFVNKNVRQGPEDILVKTSHLYVASVIKELMETTVLNDIVMRRHRIQSLWDNVPPGLDGVLRRAFLNSAIFLRPGSILHCGIRKIEVLAELEGRSICRPSSSYRPDIFPYISADESFELILRCRVRCEFKTIMMEEVDSSLLEELKHVLFSLTFPTPPVEL